MMPGSARGRKTRSSDWSLPWIDDGDTTATGPKRTGGDGSWAALPVTGPERLPP